MYFGLNIATEDDGVIVFELFGELDLGSVDTLRDALGEASWPVVLDLTELTFIDSSGVGLMLYHWREGHDLRVRNPTPVVRRTFEMTGVDGYIDR